MENTVESSGDVGGEGLTEIRQCGADRAVSWYGLHRVVDDTSTHFCRRPSVQSTTLHRPVQLGSCGLLIQAFRLQVLFLLGPATPHLSTLVY